jgi:Right handed beta helix region
MNRTACSVVVISVFTALATALATTPASAQLSVRTFVSPTGADNGFCTLLLPCRTFQAAILSTEPFGEIAVLGSAGYNAGNTFNIDKPISIINPGGFEAGISVPSGGSGIAIATSYPVYLRGLTIEGNGTGSTGISYSGVAGSLTIQNCVIRNLAGNAIDFEPNALSNLTVSDTYVANNGGNGIVVVPSGGSVTAVFTRVETDNNYTGISLNGTLGAINAAVTDSVATGNTYAGFDVLSNGLPANMMVFGSVAVNNGTGLVTSGSGSTLWVGQSVVMGNANGWQALSSSVLQSYVTNQMNGNANNEDYPPPVFGGLK